MIIENIFNLIEEISTERALDLLNIAKEKNISANKFVEYLLEVLPSLGNRLTSDEFDKIADQLGVTKHQLSIIQKEMLTGNNDKVISTINEFRKINGNEDLILDGMRNIVGESKFINNILDKISSLGSLSYIFPIIFLLFMFLLIKLRKKQQYSPEVDQYSRLTSINREY